MYHGASQACYRSSVQLQLRQHLARRTSLDIPGGMQLWKAIGVSLLVLVSVVFLCQLVLRALSAGAEESIAATDDRHYNLLITNSLLKAERSGLLVPEKVQSVAGGKLALDKPEKGQVLVFHRASGQFRYL